MKEISSSQGMKKKKKPWYVCTVRITKLKSCPRKKKYYFVVCSVLFVDPIVIYYQALGEREQQQQIVANYVVVVTLAQRLVHSPKEGFSR